MTENQTTVEMLDGNVINRIIQYISVQSTIKDDALSNGDLFLLYNDFQKFCNIALAHQMELLDFKKNGDNGTND